MYTREAALKEWKGHGEIMEMDEKGLEKSAEDKFDLKLKLGDPFMFDDIEVSEIDLSGLVELSASDMCAIDRQMSAMGYSYARPEVTGQYAVLVAARVNKKPWEYCNNMKARDYIRLRETIRAFFYARG